MKKHWHWHFQRKKSSILKRQMHKAQLVPLVFSESIPQLKLKDPDCNDEIAPFVLHPPDSQPGVHLALLFTLKQNPENVFQST
jgi:hypothetical protein